MYQSGRRLSAVAGRLRAAAGRLSVRWPLGRGLVLVGIEGRVVVAAVAVSAVCAVPAVPVVGRESSLDGSSDFVSSLPERE